MTLPKSGEKKTNKALPASESPKTAPEELKNLSEGPAGTEYYKVPAELYREGEKAETDLYLYYQSQYILTKKKGTTFTPEDFDRLAGFGAAYLYIIFESPDYHRSFLDKKLANLLDRDNVPLTRKATVLYEISEPVLEAVYDTPDSRETMNSAKSYVKNCIKYLHEKNSLPELVQLSSKNLTEHAHALHVAALAIALSKKYQKRNYAYDEIVSLGVGALLHDIGKSQIDRDILNKPSELNDEEWQLIRQHPAMGEKILAKKRDLVSGLSSRIVLEHHERINGKGYPRGIKSVHEFSQFVAIADIFNSMTSLRPYAEAQKPFETLKYMAMVLKDEFSKDILTTFIQMLGEN